MLLYDVALTSKDVAATPRRLAKIELLGACLRRARPEEIAVTVAYLSGELPQGTIGVGWASLRELPPPAAPPPTLEVLATHRALERIRTSIGAGSRVQRRAEIEGLFARTTTEERSFLLALLGGELRQGALGGIMVEAVARASDVPARDVRRAVMLAGNLGEVARAALTGGQGALARFGLTPLKPVQPMLAQTAPDLPSALKRVPEAALEWKLDGARIQAHKAAGEVRVFTRNLADITARVPEIVAVVAELDAGSAILDGEAIALGPGRRPRPFQVTMSRFGSRLGGEPLQEAIPLTPFFFDCLHLDGSDLIDSPAADRFASLQRIASTVSVPRRTAGDRNEAGAFLAAALAAGHEGVMVKALASPYEAGRRGASWLKVKQAHTLDLVVLAAEWGHGRRSGWLSNLHLGARDPSGGFVMLGKTFKGMTDAMLKWQTARLLELEVQREGIIVHVRPELVVEVAFDGLQASSRYPAGIALRFARIKGYRHDKGPEDADTVDVVRALYGSRVGEP
jgi:DNA ligase-1